jgi:hypothetical protein
MPLSNTPDLSIPKVTIASSPPTYVIEGSSKGKKGEKTK